MAGKTVFAANGGVYLWDFKDSGSGEVEGTGVDSKRRYKYIYLHRLFIKVGVCDEI